MIQLLALLVAATSLDSAVGFTSRLPTTTTRSFGGASAARFMSSENVASSSTQPTNNTRVLQKLGFLSFDLDDTLFPISPVVASANAAMIQKMADAGFTTTVPTFLQTTREIRSALDGAPITYAALRKLAIRGEMQRLMTTSVNDNIDNESSTTATTAAASTVDATLVDECYNAWLQARHDAAEEHLFADAIATLQTVRQQHTDVCIAAITNGAGNPLHMNDTLEPYFDFCVSGEDDGVFPNRKPNVGIYNAALSRYQELFPHHHKDNDDDTATPSAQYAWCHVGDCLANDVGASADCGAHAVWIDTEGGEEETAAGRLGATAAAGANTQPLWSTATASDIKERAALADQGKEKVAARIASLSELVQVIDDLLEQGAPAEEDKVKM